jgi:hypothetical protein
VSKIWHRYYFQCCGSGSIRLGPDPDPDPGLNKWLCINLFGVFNSHKHLRNLCCLTFWPMKMLFRAYFHKKKISEKVGRKFIRVRIRIRIRNRIRTFSKVGSGSGQKTPGSATLTISRLFRLRSRKFKNEHTRSTCWSAITALTKRWVQRTKQHLAKKILFSRCSPRCPQENTSQRSSQKEWSSGFWKSPRGKINLW